jgi:hypothetical protein
MENSEPFLPHSLGPILKVMASVSEVGYCDKVFVSVVFTSICSHLMTYDKEVDDLVGRRGSDNHHIHKVLT